MDSYSPEQKTFQGANGVSVPVNCDWCGEPAFRARTLESGRSAYSCEGCEPKMVRFIASVTPGCPGLAGTGWLGTAEAPDLVIHHEGKTPLTIRDHRDFKAKALKELLPPVKVSRKTPRKRQADLAPDERIMAIARRRAEIERERASLDREIAGLAKSKAVPVSKIAAVLGISRQRVYQLAA